MALTHLSDQLTNAHLRPAVAPHSARELHGVKFSVVLPVTLAAGELIGLAQLPPYCIPVEAHIYVSDVDTNGTPTMVWSAGVLNIATTGLVTGSKLIDASIIGQAAGFQRSNVHNGIFLPATWLAEAACPALHLPKTFAALIDTVAATKAAGNMYGYLYYRASDQKS